VATLIGPRSELCSAERIRPGSHYSGKKGVQEDNTEQSSRNSKEFESADRTVSERAV
jgi:hypothetical protein